ncbi:hypothetical protein PTTG_27333 [Puccinia triticina 1-1 BBBD Race 1]|uniref:Metallothionein n=1 Tax=Puccinia triticina (isolate 1-1 / race 1 (BBBD)) TaxID=630390 RepID=A0A180GKS7_PUCT1|nr:hypothetical protein PTTG_27333 [Puccinia triticina 1-1 BBBD Race 1]
MPNGCTCQGSCNSACDACQNNCGCNSCEVQH